MPRLRPGKVVITGAAAWPCQQMTATASRDAQIIQLCRQLCHGRLLYGHWCRWCDRLPGLCVLAHGAGI
jgi:hypothetical protein